MTTDISNQIIWKRQWNSEAEVQFRDALSAVRCSMEELASQTWDAATASVGGIRDYLCSYVAPASTDWSTVLLHFNSHIADALASQISMAINGPCIVLSEYGQHAWGYTLYQNGKVTDKFLNRPEYLEQDPSTVLGSSATLAEVFDAPISKITPYIRHLGVDEFAEFKVFADDEYEFGDHWVRIDFIKQLGVRYPIPGQEQSGKYVRILVLAALQIRTNMAANFFQNHDRMIFPGQSVINCDRPDALEERREAQGYALNGRPRLRSARIAPAVSSMAAWFGLQKEKVSANTSWCGMAIAGSAHALSDVIRNAVRKKESAAHKLRTDASACLAMPRSRGNRLHWGRHSASMALNVWRR